MSLRDSVIVNDTSAGTTLTIPGIVPAGSNRFGIVSVCHFSAATITEVTWGGVSIVANLVKTAVHDGSNRKRLSVYYYIAPPASSADVVVTFSASIACAGVAQAWDDIDQTTPYAGLTNTTDGSGGTSSDPQVLTVTATSGKTIVDFYFCWNAANSGSFAVGGDQTLIEGMTNDTGGGANTACFGSSYATSDGSVDMTWNASNAATSNWCMYAIYLNAAAAGGDVAAAGNLSITGAAVLNAAGSLAAAGAASITGAADLDATGTLAAAGAVSVTGAADLDATGSLVAAGALSITGAADLDAIGNLLAAGSLEITGAADLTGAAANDIAAAGSLSITGSADLDAIGQLLAAGSIVITGAADLTGVSANDIAASGALSITGTADLDAIGQLLASGSIFITGIAALTSGAVETGGTPGGSGYPVYWQGKRRKRRLEDQPNLHLKKVLDDVVNELYGELTEDDVPPAVQAKAAKLVKPFVAQKDKKLAIPPPAAVDWAALERDATRVRQLIALWRKQEEDVEIEAEDEYLLMMS